MNFLLGISFSFFYVFRGKEKDKSEISHHELDLGRRPGTPPAPRMDTPPKRSRVHRERRRMPSPSLSSGRRHKDFPSAPVPPPPPSPGINAPRQWKQMNEPGSTQIKNIFQKMIDPDSYWSVATAGIITLIISCLLLLWARPYVVLQQNEDGTVEQEKVCFTRLIVTSLVIAGTVTGVSIYLKWRRGRSMISID